MNITILDGPGAPKVPQTKITLYAFRTRFTLDEKVAIEETAVTDARVRVVAKDFDSAGYIDLSDQSVIDGVGVYVDSGVLTPDRAVEILRIE